MPLSETDRLKLLAPPTGKIYAAPFCNDRSSGPAEGMEISHPGKLAARR